MTLATTVPPPAAGPISGSPVGAGLETLLELARQGVALLLATQPDRGMFTVEGLAAQALTRMLKEPYPKRKQPSPAPPLRLKVFGDHERAWIATGELLDEVLSLAREVRAGAAPAPSHVFCLDPWAANLEKTLRPLFPTARWIAVLDLEGRRVGEDAAYWGEYEEWIKGRNFDRLVSAREALSHLPGDFWTPGDTEPLRTRLQKGDSSAKIIVIEESAEAPLETGSLASLLESCRSQGQAVLISPHLQRHLAASPDLDQGYAAAFAPLDLAVLVYTSLLSCADAYMALGRLPLGVGPLSALRNGAEIHLARVNAGDLPPAVREQVHWLNIAPSAAQPQTQQAPQPRAGVFPSEAHGPESPESGSADPSHAWWQQLSSLIQSEEKPAVVAEPSPPTSTQGKSVTAAPDFAILTCCYKYLQRFRVFLDSIARQDHPIEKIEVCVAAPGNPDGLLEYLDLFRKTHPRISIAMAKVPEEIRANRGKMINAAFEASAAPVVMAADCDLVLPPHFVRTMLAAHAPNRVSGCWRVPLDEVVTAHILTGNLDPVALFGELQKQRTPGDMPDVRQGVLGYCQVVSRKAFADVMYPEEFDRINQSDIVFVDRLREKLGIEPGFLKDLFVLHLDHPRNWSGTQVFL